MPTYEYECKKCFHQFETLQSIKDKPLRECPRCGRKDLKRLIGAGGALIFKGSGFYITDYRSKEYSRQAKAETEPKKPQGTEKGSKETDKSNKKVAPSATHQKGEKGK